MELGDGEDHSRGFDVSFGRYHAGVNNGREARSIHTLVSLSVDFYDGLVALLQDNLPLARVRL